MLMQRIHEVIRATGCMSVVEELPGSQAGLGHISLGEVEEGDEIKISFKDSCAGVEISEEAQSPVRNTLFAVEYCFVAGQYMC